MSGFNSSNPGASAAADAPAQDHVLGLTVHTLPEPGQAMTDDGRRTRVGRFKMFMVLLVCAAPVIASYFTYYVVRPEGRRNFGELIDPQRTLPDLAARSLDGKPMNLRDLKGQWLLVRVGGGACDALCEQQLYLQRQLRESLGREKDRLDRVWLVTDDQPLPVALQGALQGATVLRVPQAELAQWLQPAEGQALNAHLYLVDPIGNWMLRFPANLDVHTAPRAKRDLDRLLRAAASWDQPGR